MGVLQVLAAADASELDREEVARRPGASLVLGRRDAWRHAYLHRASDLVDAVRAPTDKRFVASAFPAVADGAAAAAASLRAELR